MIGMNYKKGKIKKYIYFDPETKKGGYGFLTTENGSEFFFNIKHCEIQDEDIVVGMDVLYLTRKGFDRTTEERTVQATALKQITGNPVK